MYFLIEMYMYSTLYVSIILFLQEITKRLQ